MRQNIQNLQTIDNSLFFKGTASSQTTLKQNIQNSGFTFVIGRGYYQLLKAEKRRFTEQQIQIEKLKSNLFPNDNLQERVDNFAILYSSIGFKLIENLYKNSKGLEQLFTIVSQTKKTNNLT